MTRQLVRLISVLILIIISAFLLISYGKGKTIDLTHQTITTNGIVSVSSFPEKSSIYVDGKLSGATDLSLSLTPGWYDFVVRKEGYQDWKKRVRVQGEVVSTLDALLIPTTPSLRTLTASGVLSPIVSPSGSKVAFINLSEKTTDDIEQKTGIWILDLRTSPLGWKSIPTKIFTPHTISSWEAPKISWTPDETNIIADATTSAMLIPSNGASTPTEIAPIFLAAKRAQWEVDAQKKMTLTLATLPIPMGDFLATTSAHLMFSPDETKVLYEATASATLPPPVKQLVGSNSTPETRTISPHMIYVYDQKEEKNYALVKTSEISNPQTIHWYNDSKHIVMVEKDTIYIIDDDGNNKRVVYAGPFDPSVLFPWPAGGKLVILTNFNKPQTPPNLYLLDLT